jgi:TPR repeat protein
MRNSHNQMGLKMDERKKGTTGSALRQLDVRECWDSEAHMRRTIFLLIVLGLLIGCDKAKPEYAKCIQAEAANDIAAAWTTCNSAIGLDPTSESGKAAATRLTALKPRYEQWQKERAAKAARDAEEKRKQETADTKAPEGVKPDEATLAACKKKKRDACSKACDGGYMPSCLALGKILWNEKSVALQRQCLEPLQKACNANLGKACTALADCISRQSGDTKAEKTGLVLKACELNDGNGCYLAGIYLKDEHGVAADPGRGQALLEKAFQLLPKACDAGDDDACYTLAVEYQWGASKTVQKSPDKAAVYSKKACMLDNQSGCVAYANWH